MEGTKSKNKYKELIKLTPLGLQILKWYSIAIVAFIAGYIIMRSDKDKEFRNKYMWIAVGLIPVEVLIMGAI